MFRRSRLQAEEQLKTKVLKSFTPDLEMKQGGRWEEAHHAPGEWDEILKGNTKIIDRMWGDSLIAQYFHQAASRGFSFDEMKEYMKNFNTWRQISGD